MPAKEHPKAYVVVYVDGRVETVFPEETKTYKNAILIGLIEGSIRKMSKTLGEQLDPGRYEVRVTKFRKFPKANIEFDLHEV